MKKLRKRILVLGITFMTLFCGTLTVHATTKTAGVKKDMYGLCLLYMLIIKLQKK